MQVVNLQIHFDPVQAETIAAIATRAKALVCALIPKPVSTDVLEDNLSSVITHDVVNAFKEAAGDFYYVMPYALLKAAAWFHEKSGEDVIDNDLDDSREAAAEVIAARLVSTYTLTEQSSLLTTRFSDYEDDEIVTTSARVSVIEFAVDTNRTRFLCSSECQRVVMGIWRGFFSYAETKDGFFKLVICPPNGRGVADVAYDTENRGVDHNDELAEEFHASRTYGFTRKLAIPLYQFIFRTALWVIFVAAFSLAVKTPDRDFGAEDILLYTQVVGYLLEDLVYIYKVSFPKSFSLWMSLNWGIYLLLWVSFGYRLASIYATDPVKIQRYRHLTFNFMSCAAPLVWMKILSVFDLFAYIGSMQIVVMRMLRESAVFFFLIAIMAIGFMQAYVGIDLKQTPDIAFKVANDLFMSLLGAAPLEDYRDEGSSTYPFGLVLIYAWTFFTTVILLNILVALFGSAYSQSAEDVDRQFQIFFAAKAVGYVRAPDQYVYPAPFNLVEALFIAPYERFMSHQTYAKLNGHVMSILFFIPFATIAFYEKYNHKKILQLYDSLMFEVPDFESFECDPPVPSTEQSSKKICKVSFRDLVSKFPET